MTELYHHGIKGMHWGIRRYQNPDGSLTTAGKIRYGIALGDKVDLSGLTNREIKQLIKRKQLEHEYNILSNKHINTGKTIITGAGTIMNMAIDTINTALPKVKKGYNLIKDMLDKNSKRR